MHRFLSIFVALIASCLPALAQTTVKQSGNVTPGHGSCWTTNGIVQDCGTATIPFLNSIGTAGSGLTICASTDVATAAGMQRICLGGTTSGGAQINVQNFGTAPAQPLSIIINGTTYQFPFTSTGVVGPNSTTIGDIALWNNTNGTLLSDAGPIVTIPQALNVNTTGNEATLHVDGGTLAPGGIVIYYEAIQPALPVATQDAILYEITGSGSAAINNNAMIVHYLAGYTGPNHNAALYGANDNAGTGTDIFPAAGGQVKANLGLWGIADATTSGANLGTGGHAVGSSFGNVGLLGQADGATAGFNVGATGWAAGGGVNVGGWFHLNQTTPPAASAALIADNAAQSSPIALFQVNGATKVTVDSVGDVQLAPGVLANGAQALSITTTQPAAPVATQQAILFTITSAGSAAQSNRGLEVDYAAGYTGSSATSAAVMSDMAAGTGSTLIPAAGSNAMVGNRGGVGSAIATTTGLNAGLYGNANAGNINVGVLGLAQVAKNSATNIGGAFSAVNTGSAPVQVGVWASLNQVTPPTTSAAAIFDNGGTSSPIALFQANGVTKVTVDNSGNLIAPTIYGGTSSSQALTIQASSAGTGADVVHIDAGGREILVGAKIAFGLGTASPQMDFTFTMNSATGIPAVSTGHGANLIGPDSNTAGGASIVGWNVQSFAFPAQNTLQRADGTAAAATALVNADVIGGVLFAGTSTAGASPTYVTGARILAVTTEGWSGTNTGTELRFHTTAAGGTGNTVAASLYAGLVVGTGTNDPGTSAALLTPQAFGSLATCTSSLEGALAEVNNSNTATWGATIAAGGSNKVLAHCNGANWTVAGA